MSDEKIKNRGTYTMRRGWNQFLNLSNFPQKDVFEDPVHFSLTIFGLNDFSNLGVLVYI